ncbi:hypothetical protein AG1IA_01145 [Rhizoctonia solani AG-1 IA]|uniref:Uncharacterized protein n=1 Tax=Thanatephorus cucumeris (strain AG1-IA) TaxID=983506 RepID=L8X859_THACA|nr:hypothetical protein AG1IA_01145 [Rhizoctonia solani AG-1 IA]
MRTDQELRSLFARCVIQYQRQFCHHRVALGYWPREQVELN